MLTRQKILLLMLKQAGRPVQRLELMKWCFLLRQESASGGGSSFYDFVPYKFGPCSFALYQEIDKLKSMSYVLPHGERAWELNPELVSDPGGLGWAVVREAKKVVNDFGGFSTDDLLDYVYQRHPEFTVNSERRKLIPKPTAEVAIYTAGYEGISIDGFLNVLVENGIERLIDVRSNPTARRYGFHKSTLNRLTNKVGIEYRHFAELGIRPEIRNRFPVDNDRSVMFDEYEAATLPGEAAAVREVASLMSERPSVLVCLEADASCCHRSRLAIPLSETTGLSIIHLRADP